MSRRIPGRSKGRSSELHACTNPRFIHPDRVVGALWSARESGPRSLASRSELVRAADELGCRLAGVASVGGTRESLERALTTAAAHEVQLLTRERGVRRARSECFSIRPACADGREVRGGAPTDLVALSVVTVWPR